MANQLPREPQSRRNFLKATATLAAAGGAAGIIAGCTDMSSPPKAPLVRPNSVVLFQGDSITDAGRARDRRDNANDAGALGRGYAFLAACQLLAAHPQKKLKFYNRGISGNKVYQLAERWQTDCLDLKPDVLTILIGVNDIWHKLNGKYDGTVRTYEEDYDALLQRTKRNLPEVRLVICEPFVLRCGAVDDKWFPEFDAFRAAARKLAIKHNAVFVPFQKMFDEAVEQAPPQYWAADGVHPTLAGSALMAEMMVRVIG